MTRRPPPLRRLALLLSLPVLLLAGMGVWVVRAERARVEAEWRTEAERRRDGLLAELPDEVLPRLHHEQETALQSQLVEAGYLIARRVIRGTEPPPPGKAWAAYEKLLELMRAGNREEALKLHDHIESLENWRPKFSPSGIPLEPLLMRARMELAAPADKVSQANSVCDAAIEWPSVLTSRLVAEALQYLPAFMHRDWLEKAAKAEEVLAAAERIGRHQAASGAMPTVWDTTDADAVRPIGGEWVEGLLVRSHDKTHVHVLPYEQLHDLMQPVVQRFFGEAAGARDMTAEIAWHGGVVYSARRGTEMATGTKGRWRVWVFATSPDALASAIAERTRFLTWVLSGAVLVVALAMWLTWRAFKRQAELARLQAEFVASVSHELRTPVASIGVLAERLEDGKADAAQTVEYHRFIAREGRRLAALVDNVLDFSRIERGAKAYDFEHTELPRLVRETAALMRPHAEEKGLALTAEIEDVPEPYWPPVDAVAIRQALVNLLDNAIKFTPSGGTVTVKFSALDRDVMIHVRDTGIGIPPSEHARIFERFHRVDNGLRRETTGAGIGLSIVKHNAEAHGARVSVSSELGRGAVFTIHFSAPAKS
jgi:signal transduction histidine kinase